MCFPKFARNRQEIEEMIRREEEAFNKTLDKGIEHVRTSYRCASRMSSANARRSDSCRGSADRPDFAGRFAFKLYDTYGFPLDLTELMARERGLTVDIAGFEKLMDEQRERARKAQKKEEISVEEGELERRADEISRLRFSRDRSGCRNCFAGQKPDELNIVLDRTPFYAEMGGQVGDRGLLTCRDTIGRKSVNCA